MNGKPYSHRPKPTPLEAATTRITELEALAETLKNEAQIHAMEAKTANATINEINQFISGATGEPANWHGAKPVKDFVSDLRSQLEAAKKDAERYRWLRQSDWMGDENQVMRTTELDIAIDAAIQAEGKA